MSFSFSFGGGGVRCRGRGFFNCDWNSNNFGFGCEDSVISDGSCGCFGDEDGFFCSCFGNSVFEGGGFGSSEGVCGSYVVKNGGFILFDGRGFFCGCGFFGLFFFFGVVFCNRSSSNDREGFFCNFSVGF